MLTPSSSDTGDMIFFGNIREPEEQAVWVHEMAHSIDWHNGPNGTDDFSSEYLQPGYEVQID